MIEVQHLLKPRSAYHQPVLFRAAAAGNGPRLKIEVAR
jgi:hypothetical protein